ncbi:hypothetical protein BH10PAT3_BH10PAT3_3380 [soil metagenome]
MFSGLEFTNYSGRLIGGHQQVDRIARRHLNELLAYETPFPKIRQILQFEGRKGPDGIKVKSPAKDEPWHFFDPLSDNTDAFMKLLSIHYKGLTRELRAENNERAAFEAAWLAHAIVDGLTPAHHYPFEEKISELRGGESNATRTSYKKKIVFKGKNKRTTANNMFKAFGPRGIYVSHWIFEWGFSAIIRPLRFPDARPKKTDILGIESFGYKEYFMQAARHIAMLHLYEEFLDKGWTPVLSRKIRQDLAPLMIKTVTTLWYQAAKEAGL